MTPQPVKTTAPMNIELPISPSTSQTSTPKTTPTTPAPEHVEIKDPLYTEIPNTPASATSLHQPTPDLELLQPMVYCPPQLQSPTPKPIIVLVSDEWHTPLHYARLTGLLNSHGYITIVPELPSNVAEGLGVSLADDKQCVVAVLENWVVRQRREVLVVMHGYGGIPGTMAVRPFLKAKSVGGGTMGGVVGLLYLAAWALPKGVSRADFMEANPEWERKWVQTEGGFSLPTNAQHHLYNDLSAADSKYSTRRLVPHCTAGDTEPTTTDCSGGDVATTYLVCENDKSIPTFIQEKFVRNLGKCLKVVGCDSGHSPFLGQTMMLARLVRGMAGEIAEG